MYHYSARQALMAAKRQDLMEQAARAKAVREARAARGKRPSWFGRSTAEPRRVRMPRAERVPAAEAAVGRAVQQPS